jgi:hypothetical protein
VKYGTVIWDGISEKAVRVDSAGSDQFRESA